jgi:tetratricopeptide (TPR) repeat protein
LVCSKRSCDAVLRSIERNPRRREGTCISWTALTRQIFHDLWSKKPDDDDLKYRFASATNNRGTVLLETGEMESAREAFLQAANLFGQLWTANPLRLRAHRDSRISDLEVAMALHEDVVRHTPAGHPDYQAHLTNLANDQIDLYYCKLNLPSTRVDVSMQPKSALDINLLRRADNLLQGALDAGSGTHADLAKALAACAAVREGLALQHLAEHGRDDAAHAEQVIAAFRVAVGSGIECDPATSMRIAVKWGRWAFARKSWEEAVEAFEHVLQLSHRLFRAQHDRCNREAWLREAQASGSMLAYALFELDRSPGAVPKTAILMRIHRPHP